MQVLTFVWHLVILLGKLFPPVPYLNLLFMVSFNFPYTFQIQQQLSVLTV